MQIKIGKIYKVKPEFRNLCPVFKNIENSTYIRFFNNKCYNILNKNKENANQFCNCFKPEHLEPIEKTLYNLEIGDNVESTWKDKFMVIGLIESSPENPVYVLNILLNKCGDEVNYTFPQILTAKGLEKNNWKIVQPEPVKEIKEMTVEEVSKLVGKKVKIVE